MEQTRTILIPVDELNLSESHAAQLGYGAFGLKDAVLNVKTISQLVYEVPMTLQEEEWTLISKRADLLGMSVDVYLRYCMQNARVRSFDDKKEVK